MILNVKKFQEVCKDILDAVDESVNAPETATLELLTKENKLLLSVTNKEYFVTVALDIDSKEELHAVISASSFLKLISKITTETISLSIINNTLIVKGNGSYKFPLIFDEESLLKLPEIVIENVTNEFEISTSILQDIFKNNTKELLKSGIKNPTQSMFYIDEQGAITYASGACVTSFTLPETVKLLLSEKLVKLFKLFTEESVTLTIGYSFINENITQTRIRLKDSKVTITSITNNDSATINSIPVKVIRNVVNSVYNNKVVFNKQLVLDALDRLSIFSKKDVVTLYTYLEFDNEQLTIYDTKKENSEKILLEQSNVEDKYTCILNTKDLMITLNSQKEEFVVMKFGNGRSVVFEKANVKNVLPECRAN